MGLLTLYVERKISVNHKKSAPTNEKDIGENGSGAPSKDLRPETVDARLKRLRPGQGRSSEHESIGAHRHAPEAVGLPADKGSVLQVGVPYCIISERMPLFPLP